MTKDTTSELVKTAKASADAMMAEFHRVCDAYEYMEPDGLKLMPDYVRARRAALDAVANYEATRAHVAKSGALPC